MDHNVFDKYTQAWEKEDKGQTELQIKRII